jgi:putative membrane protein
MFHMWDMPLGMGWWMAFGGLWMLIFWGGLIALIVWVITKFVRGKDISPKYNSLDIAKERYAKGEISKEEFEQIKRDLS